MMPPVIKFRAKYRKGGWCYGSPAPIGMEVPIERFYGFAAADMFIPESIGMFSGVRSFGSDIYQHDVVQFATEWSITRHRKVDRLLTREVVLIDDGQSFRFEPFTDPSHTDDEQGDYFIFVDPDNLQRIYSPTFSNLEYGDMFRVVGNTIDNPELIRKGTEGKS